MKQAIMRLGWSLGITLVLFAAVPMAQAQLAGTNLAEFQLGNLPDEDPANLTSLYEQLNLSYRYNKIFLKTRLETFYPSSGADKSYTQLSQYALQYRDQGFKIQVGSLYHTIGRGILMRNYEQPASIWESRGYRVRYGFYKDLKGLSASYTNEHFKVKLLRGRVLAVDLPPTLTDQQRRPDLVEGGEFNYSLKGQTLGLAFLRHTNDGNIGNYATAYLDGFYKSLSYYGEYAFGDNEARALYASTSFSSGAFGVSLEYKNYQNFLLGAGINDPPTLVKEHASRLLNRSTHVPILTNESGYQADFSYHFANNSQLSFNHSMARNQISDDLSYTFREFYLDYEMYFGEHWYSKLFADVAQDPFNAENQRFTSGLVMEREISQYTLGMDFEVQLVNREYSEPSQFTNLYTALSIGQGSKLFASLVMELSSDPFLIEGDGKWVAFPGLIVSYKPVNSTTVSLFAGKRRGGPACNSGVCYDVLDFEGVELRLSSSF